MEIRNTFVSEHGGAGKERKLKAVLARLKELQRAQSVPTKETTELIIDAISILANATPYDTLTASIVREWEKLAA